MRPHSQVAAQKLYGRIDTAIEAGTKLNIMVSNKYNTYAFSGAKSGTQEQTAAWGGTGNGLL